jgi:hypothetical protein
LVSKPLSRLRCIAAALLRMERAIAGILTPFRTPRTRLALVVARFHRLAGISPSPRLLRLVYIESCARLMSKNARTGPTAFISEKLVTSVGPRWFSNPLHGVCVATLVSKPLFGSRVFFSAGSATPTPKNQRDRSQSLDSRGFNSSRESPRRFKRARPKSLPWGLERVEAQALIS